MRGGNATIGLNAISIVLTFLFAFRREKRDIPFIISACIREVEKRGMSEVGIYRVSGSASDLAKLKKSFETSKSERHFFKEITLHK